jgi:predicted glycoside hydrolase/deacetylase ChbG (UPF0249 family)
VCFGNMVNVYILFCLVKIGDSEHSKADSISWHAIRYAVTRLCIGQMEEFLRVAGVEPTGVDSCSLVAFYPVCFKAFMI